MQNKIKTLKTIHFAICAGTIIAYIFIGQLSIDKLMIQSIDPTEYIYIAIPILAFVLSNFLFKYQMKQVDPKLGMEDNLPVYQNASLIKWAILEGAAMVILFTKPDFLIYGLSIIVYLMYIRPTEDRIMSDIQNVSN